MLSFKDLKELREESMFQIRSYSREMQSILIFHSGRRQSRVVNEEKISFIGKKNINLREINNEKMSV